MVSRQVSFGPLRREACFGFLFLRVGTGVVVAMDGLWLFIEWVSSFQFEAISSCGPK